MSPTIRPERAGDEAAIAALVGEAFRTATHSAGTEAQIVDALRSADALTLSLVAVKDEKIVGHAAFSPVTIAGADRGWFGLGPVAVLPAGQGQGIGRALIDAGMAQLRESGARGCVVLGEPAYYGRFGFEPDARLTLAGPPPQYFQAIRVADETAEGAVAYHSAFAS